MLLKRLQEARQLVSETLVNALVFQVGMIVFYAEKLQLSNKLHGVAEKTAEIL